MVLDEDALESMLRRQNGESKDEERPPAELTDETEEFEVYERPRSEEDEAPEPAPGPSSRLDHVQDDEPFEELPGRNAGEKEEPVDAEPPRSPEGAPAPTAPEPAQASEDEAPPAPQSAPAPQAPAQTEQAPRRPRVWPPLGDEERTHKPREDAPTAPEGPAQEPAATATPQPEASPQAAAPQAATGATGGSACRLAIVQATFNADVTDMMADIAAKRADQAGCTVTHTAQVAGVYDLPLTAQALARRDDVDAVVVLGAVVQGETQHDLVITQSTATTLQRVALEAGKPIGFGVTGPGMTWKQAEARVVNAKHAVDAVVTQWQALRKA